MPLLVTAIITFIGAAFAGTKALFDQAIYGMVSSVDPTSDPTYDLCVAELGEGATPGQIAAMCESSTATIAPDSTAFTTFAVLLAIGVALLVVRVIRRSAARRDTRITGEESTRVSLYGFDPLAVGPVHEGFGWDTLGNVDAFTGQVMDLALTGHQTYPAASQLPALDVPKPRRQHFSYPPAINTFLTQIREQDGIA